MNERVFERANQHHGEHDGDPGRVEIGAMYMGGDGITVKDFGRAAESVGFDSVWTGDHLAHYVDGIASLGILAGCTDRVTIGSNVIVVPFRPAAVVAKGLLTTIVSARRRVIMGVGPGGDVPIEFELAGADMATRGRYTDEALDVIAGLWRGEPFSYGGEWNRFADVVMAPATGPRPEVWVGGRSAASLRRAVLRGSGYNPYLVSPDQVADRYLALRELAAELGVALDGFDFAATTFYVPGSDPDHALDRGMDHDGFRGVSAEHMRRTYLLGGVDDLRRGVDAYLAAGVRHLVIGCAPGAPDQLDAYMTTTSALLADLRTAAKPAAGELA
jgi:alkanesulfonate monooxygenase SsuD/methylene tetrahydromethanopterin reductase-like flavin-dependent oxidoreductase (luciferase family)